MKPYDGIETWIWLILVLLAALAITIIVFAFKKEKQERNAGDPVLIKKMRGQKYGLFGVFFVVVASIVALAFVAHPISQNTYHAEIVSHVESHNVRLVEGFVDPQNPLVAGEHAKFVVETESGLVRCRATAEKNQDVDFSCQDYSTENRDFTVPLSDINDNVKALTPEQIDEEEAAEKQG